MTYTTHVMMKTALLPLRQNGGMTPELKALVERVAVAMNDAALTARTQNPDIPDEEYDAAQALAAIRCVAEATRRAGAEGGLRGG